MALRIPSVKGTALRRSPCVRSTCSHVLEGMPSRMSHVVCRNGYINETRQFMNSREPPTFAAIDCLSHAL